MKLQVIKMFIAYFMWLELCLIVVVVLVCPDPTILGFKFVRKVPNRSQRLFGTGDKTLSPFSQFVGDVRYSCVFLNILPVEIPDIAAYDTGYVTWK